MVWVVQLLKRALLRAIRCWRQLGALSRWLILHLTQERNPPLRLLLGSDAYAAVEKNDLARLEEAQIWKELSVSTDFETE